jgi:hypothetical protein
MKWLATFGVVIFIVSGALASTDYGKKNSSIDVACLTEKCLIPVGSCALNEGCRTALSCAKKCFDLWDKDTTKEKYHVQNCSNTCAFTYGEVAAYSRLMECAGDHKCIAFPAIPSECKAPNDLTLLKKLSSQVLNGSWWVVKGYHPVYDCYPCQRLNFNWNSTTKAWSYNPNYEVYLSNGSLLLVQQYIYNFPNTTPGDNITFYYHDMGLTHTETWWLIDAAEDFSYVILYYCGGTLQWYYDGALVLSREKTLPYLAYTDIAASYSRAVGLDSTKFCNTETAPCPEP